MYKIMPNKKNYILSFNNIVLQYYSKKNITDQPYGFLLRPIPPIIAAADKRAAENTRQSPDIIFFNNYFSNLNKNR